MLLSVNLLFENQISQFCFAGKMNEGMNGSNIKLLLQRISQHTTPHEEEEYIRACAGDVFKCLTFIYDKFHNAKKLETELSSLPEAGQLIGRLSSSKYVKGDPRLFEVLLRCNMTLIRRNAVSPLELKAKDWALDKIRSMICFDKDLLVPSCELGATNSDLTCQYLHQATVTIYNHLKERMKANDSLPPHDEMHNQLVAMTTLLFSSPSTKDFSSVWEMILDILSYDNFPELAQTIYHRLSETQMWTIFNKERSLYLSDCGLCKLYKAYRPALEQEMLIMVQECCRFKLVSSMKNVISGRPLHRVCSGQDVVMMNCMQMLQALYQETSSHKVLLVSHALRCCIQELTLKDGKPVPTSMDFFLPCCLQPLAQSLLSFQSGMTLSEAEDGMKMTAKSMQMSTLDSSITNMQRTFLLHSCMTCYFQGLKILLIGDKKQKDDCLELICYYHNIHSVEKDKTQILLGVVVTSLRPLLSKSTLAEADLMCALTAANFESVKNENLKTITHHLLLAFVFHAVEGVRWMDKILEMTNSNSSEEEKLVTLMASQENLEIDFTTWPPHKLQSYKSYLSQLREKLYDVNEEIISAVSLLIGNG